MNFKVVYSDRQNKANYKYISNNKYAIKIYDVKISSYMLNLLTLIDQHWKKKNNLFISYQNKILYCCMIMYT